jgi:hypothetical protein
MRTAAVIVLALLVSPGVQAQTPAPSTAAILARIAALEKEIVTLKAQLPPASPAAVPSRPPSLAEASAAAAKTEHEWPVSQNLGSAGPVGNAAPPVYSADNPPPELARFVATIKAQCLREFPTNASVRSYCESSQIKPMLETSALNKSGVLDNPAGEVIRLKCLHDWPKDTALFNRCVQAELKK